MLPKQCAERCQHFLAEKPPLSVKRNGFPAYPLNWYLKPGLVESSDVYVQRNQSVWGEHFKIPHLIFGCSERLSKRDFETKLNTAEKQVKQAAKLLDEYREAQRESFDAAALAERELQQVRLSLSDESFLNMAVVRQNASY